MSYDIIIAIIIVLFAVFCLVRRIKYDYSKVQNNRTRLHKEEPFITRMLEQRLIYGLLIIMIGGCIAYVYYRATGQLDNIIPYIPSYYSFP